MTFRPVVSFLTLLLIGWTALPAQAQHGRGHHHRRPAPRRVVVVHPHPHPHPAVVRERTVIVAPRRR